MDVVERRWTSAVNRLLQQPELAEAPAEPLLGDFEGGGHGRDVVAEAADGGFEVVSREGGGSLKARALLHQVIDRGPRDAEAAGGGMRPEAGGLEGGEELVLGHVRGLARLCLDGDRWGRSWARRCGRRGGRFLQGFFERRIEAGFAPAAVGDHQLADDVAELA